MIASLSNRHGNVLAAEHRLPVLDFAYNDVIGRMGKQDVAVTRVSCRAWGHDVCTTRVRFK